LERSKSPREVSERDYKRNGYTIYMRSFSNEIVIRVRCGRQRMWAKKAEELL